MKTFCRLTDVALCEWKRRCACLFLTRPSSALSSAITTGRSQQRRGVIEQNRHFSQKLLANFAVRKWGDLKVETGSRCHVQIQPLNPHLYPSQEQALVEATDHVVDSSQVLVECTNSDSTSQLVATENQESVVSQTKDSRSDVCIFSVPIKYNVDVKVGGQRKVSVESMQNDSLSVAVDDGNCFIANIQTGSLVATAHGGNIISDGLLEGDAKLVTHHKGCVRLHKPLCRRLEVTTEHGDIVIGSLYADESVLVSQHGSVEIHNAHRAVNVHLKDSGNLVIDSLDGSLEATVKTGNVTVYVCQHTTVNINVHSGDITLKVPNTLESRLDLSGNTVTVDKQLDHSQLFSDESSDQRHITGTVNQSTGSDPVSATLRAHSDGGSVSVVCQDWISSLKLSHTVNLKDT